MVKFLKKIDIADLKVGFQKTFKFCHHHHFYDWQIHIIWIGCFYIYWMGIPYLDMD